MISPILFLFSVILFWLDDEFEFKNWTSLTHVDRYAIWLMSNSQISWEIRKDQKECIGVNQSKIVVKRTRHCEVCTRKKGRMNEEA